jgi:hypothetical protein
MACEFPEKLALYMSTSGISGQMAKVLFKIDDMQPFVKSGDVTYQRSNDKYILSRASIQHMKRLKLQRAEDQAKGAAKKRNEEKRARAAAKEAEHRGFIEAVEYALTASATPMTTKEIVDVISGLSYGHAQAILFREPQFQSKNNKKWTLKVDEPSDLP